MNKRICCAAFGLFFLGLLFAPLQLSAQDKITKVKATFLFKFFDYVTWPEGKKPGVDGEGLLCTYGPHSFGDLLENIAGSKNVDYPLRTQAISRLEEARVCHVLFVSQDHSNESDKVPGNELAGLDARGILLVSDRPSFLEDGGAIEMGDHEGRIHLKIDPANAEKHKLKISSRLLNISEVRR